MLLVIDQRNAHVDCDRQTLLVRRGSESPQRIPLRLLENVVIIGNPSIETRVWRALAAAAVPATLLPARGNQPPTVLGPGLNVTLPLRRLQYRCAEDGQCALHLARWIIGEKLRSHALALSHPCLKNQDCTAFCQQRDNAEKQLHQTASIEALMGLEGSTASAWFSLLADTLPKAWRFTGRNRRPPRDPVNALLSLGYTLLMSDVRQVIISEGMDPAFGFLHQPHPAREALTLDLTECFRAGVDDFVLSLLPRLAPTDFNYHDTTGCRLNKDRREIFFTAWAEQCQAWPQLYAQTDATVRQHIPLREQIRGKIMALRQTLKQTLGEPA